MSDSSGQKSNQKPELHFTISMAEPSNRFYKVELECKGWISDTIDFKIPQWMPGYYQIMNYYRDLYDFSVKSADGKNISFLKPDERTWRIIVPRKNGFRISYNVRAVKKFVANNFLDTTHGYIVPPATFIYIDKNINTPVRITVKPYSGWRRIATGLEQVKGTMNEFTAPDFDIFYDCPLLIGNLDELPSFQIRGVEHRFIAYNPGTFDRDKFISALKKTIHCKFQWRWT
ncbi:MAG: hypothetical protein HZB98_07470 [Bacteroidia bacterium]|nr:hypothetical protein [Bacteroidia bacterium]